VGGLKKERKKNNCEGRKRGREGGREEENRIC
jgi:hypothetical protein